ncbi:aminotransferase class I/II-fold pyridoxal phosphate-dependent enzyme [candidate division KSB3 bacterium]|uniref:Aminotransferase class I/II-fold pyridoxal phosphate-dependent enzyme n=1 Tax=candidate division KSB3 bacterium TaxID=2044937 RepID=A0A9D5Q781_9BACT|nr:aminotransferase class I/II-fold pyridoxal phosphate-dependent enzyme [candidate division KSB3 bacterium]
MTTSARTPTNRSRSGRSNTTTGFSVFIPSTSERIPRGIQTSSPAFWKRPIWPKTADPNFSVFADLSIRVGGNPFYHTLAPEDGSQRTDATIKTLESLIKPQRPKLLLISNPVNPTGQHLFLQWVESLTAACALKMTAVVVDEPYG